MFTANSLAISQAKYGFVFRSFLTYAKHSNVEDNSGITKPSLSSIQSLSESVSFKSEEFLLIADSIFSLTLSTSISVYFGDFTLMATVSNQRIFVVKRPLQQESE